MDISSFLLGAAIAAIGFFFTGFLKRAGEDAYGWIKKKVNPNAAANTLPQVIVRLDTQNDHGAGGRETAMAPTLVERITPVTFEEIRKALDRAPPLQREQVADGYVGLHVQWDTIFRSGEKKTGGLLQLYLAIKESSGGIVVCEVSAVDYRELSILPAGAQIHVIGEIARATTSYVELKDVRLQIRR